MATYIASVETDAGTYQHGFHLGTDIRVARSICEELFSQRRPKQGAVVRSVGLKQAGKLVDTYDGVWANDDNSAWEDWPDEI